ncbi:DMT family transporter [Pelomonas sp. KK5]|uniref:DMT family transporter n=1 Tax=Pelomonas sp. KK5 TaxID=1855730 RepID=UPI00097BDA71|nr:DMT family transporter [Pelomonas sp. KK5]
MDKNTAIPRPAGIAALLVATISWGGMFLVGKAVLPHVGPAWLTLIRYTLATAVMLPAMLLLRGGVARAWQQLRAEGPDLALRGLAGFGVFGLLLLIGLRHTVPSHGAVMIATTPISTQLLRWLLDGQRPGRATLLASLLALAGVGVISGLLLPGGATGGATGGDAAWHWDLVVLAGTLGWVVYTRGAARHPTLDVLEYTGLTLVAAWPLLALGTLALTALGLEHVPATADLAASWHGLLYIGAISSALAVLAYNVGVRSLGAVTASAFLNFVPVSALLIAALLGKLPTGAELLGVGMVVAGLLVHARSVSAAAPRVTMTVIRECALVATNTSR